MQRLEDFLIVIVVALITYWSLHWKVFSRGLSGALADWRRSVQQKRQHPQYRRNLITSLLGAALFCVFTGLSLAKVISDTQYAALTAVAVGWLIVGYYCIGKRPSREGLREGKGSE